MCLVEVGVLWPEIDMQNQGRERVEHLCRSSHPHHAAASCRPRPAMQWGMSGDKGAAAGWWGENLQKVCLVGVEFCGVR